MNLLRHVPCDRIKKNQSRRKWWSQPIKASESEEHNPDNSIFFLFDRTLLTANLLTFLIVYLHIFIYTSFSYS
jgi:hypothetical protein